MGFVWLVDTHKMIKNIKNLKEADGTDPHEVPTVTYQLLFPFRVDRTSFFQTTNLKNAMYVWKKAEVSLHVSNQSEKEQSKNRTLYKLARLQ